MKSKRWSSSPAGNSDTTSFRRNLDPSCYVDTVAVHSTFLSFIFRLYGNSAFRSASSHWISTIQFTVSTWNDGSFVHKVHEIGSGCFFNHYACCAPTVFPFYDIIARFAYDPRKEDQAWLGSTITFRSLYYSLYTIQLSVRATLERILLSSPR